MLKNLVSKSLTQGHRLNTEISIFQYILARGKKWVPGTYDQSDHEAYSTYLKRWRRRKIQENVDNISEESSNTFENTKNKNRRYNINMDLFHYDGFREDNTSEARQEDYKKEKQFKKSKKKSGGKKQNFEYRWSPFKVKEYEDEEWDWQELYSMYGDGSMDFENDDEPEMNGFKSRKKERFRFNYNSKQVTMPECSGHLRDLGLPDDTVITEKTIKQAYYKCALKWHPDKHQGIEKGEAENKFKKAQAAYKALKLHLE